MNMEDTNITTTINAARIRETLGETLNRVGYGHERVIIEKHGRPVAALISMEDFRLLQALEDHLDVDAAREALAETGTVALKDVKGRLGL